ncbi:MAG: hypothetical protein QMD08_08185 [Actinomycetota bacterium]|nr:hypothetical protein [Actinomycetota bacterium]
MARPKGVSAWRWNEKKLEAARMIAEGGKTLSQIGFAIEVGTATIAKWKKRKEFDEYVESLVRKTRETTERNYVRIANLATLKLLQRMNAQDKFPLKELRHLVLGLAPRQIDVTSAGKPAGIILLPPIRDEETPEGKVLPLKSVQGGKNGQS